MKPTIQKALNKQINEEMESSYLYLSMAAYFEDQNLAGMAQWMKAQSIEEVNHAMQLYTYIVDRGGKVELQAIKAPQLSWKSPLDAFNGTYTHEKHITKCIHDLMDLATKEKDHASTAMLQWFVTEQVEEEASTSEIVEKLKLIDSAPGGIYMIDKELASRPMPQLQLAPAE
ncbi:MAG: ferritin [Nanoarchaeota archaeon]|nr:ferritin [Nanoarchaeota archaeon]